MSICLPAAAPGVAPKAEPAKPKAEPAKPKAEPANRAETEGDEHELATIRVRTMYGCVFAAPRRRK